MRTLELPYFIALLIGVALLLLWGAARAWGQVGTATVTFDVTLPPETPPGDPIYVAGDFQQWDPDATPLTRDSPTHAHGSVTVPEGSTIAFKFTRGSWDRVEKAFDCNEISNRTATATDNSTISVTVANWGDRCVAVYDSRTERVRLETTVLGVPKEFYVYTPPGYAGSPTRRYPVIYLFRGHQKEWINKSEDDTRGGKNVIDVYEQLLAAGTVGPMILVFPGISSDDNTVPGMLTNFKEPHRTQAAGVGNGKFKDYFLQDVVGYVDTNYRTVADKAGRGVDGFSLGGFMSAKIASQHPELFKTAGAFDGTHFYADLDCSDVDAVRDATTFTTNSMFDPAFGNPRDTAYAALNNGPNLICNSTPAQMQSIRWFVQYGPLTGEPNSSNFNRGEHLMEKLTAKGVTNGLTAVLEGGHNWKTADEHMRQTLPLHWQALGPATVIDPPALRISAIAKQGNGGVILEGKGVPLEEHQVEAAATLAEQFQPIGTARADANGRITFEDATAAGAATRFYRFTYP